MPSASEVLSARESGQPQPDSSTVRLVTLDIESMALPEPLRIVNRAAKKFIAEGKTYLPYPFDETLPNIKPNIKPEMSITFVQVAKEQEETFEQMAQIYPWPTVRRSTWEVTLDGTITKTSSFLYPMPIRNTVINDNGLIDVRCYDEDLDDIPLNPIVYTTTDHPGLKSYISQ